MTHIVGDACVRCKFTDCVEVCPVDCFHEGPNILVIDPEVCIDCGACIEMCPVEAIYLDEDLPKDQAEYVDINTLLSLKYPVITEAKDPHPESEKYREVKGKSHLIEN
jgi:ferredoxin|tara:strand:- start:3462 stop:3785 length:324 start_codon:yes stop_codon:yes gene_type:complete